ncbi:MAG TPA: hypothetical protein VJM51_01465 [Dehalococcoidia bacterium]|nr:hypothetical protein [Dehalococcoidia bacterium]
MVTRIKTQHCQHYWLIESSNGAGMRGTCRRCGTHKSFQDCTLQPEQQAPKIRQELELLSADALVELELQEEELFRLNGRLSFE